MTDRVFQTKRLLIRPLEESDLDLCIEMNTDPLVMKYVPPLQKPADVEDSMPKWLALNLENSAMGVWIMVEKETDISFGALALVEMPKSDPEIEPVEYTGNVEIGYRSIPSHWGRGFTTEGATALLDYAFKNSGLSLIAACTDSANSNSQNILKKMGMSHLGKRRVYGEYEPYFEITRAEWAVNKNG